MVKRSLIAKVYLYALVAFLVFSPLSVLISQALMAKGHADGLSLLLADQASFVAEELEATVQAGHPSMARLQGLARSLHLDIQYVPWQQRAAYPAALASAKSLSPSPDRRAGRWVRLDADGRPVGAIHVQLLGPGPRGRQPQGRPPAPPFGRPPFGPPLPVTVVWVAMMAVMLIPPLWLWVIRPLRRMVDVAHRLGEGDLGTPVPVGRSDEFGELEKAFESLRQRVQGMLAQRERLLTDISHEIRGPMARMNLVVPLLRQAGAPAHLTDLMENEIREIDAMLGELMDYVRGRHDARQNEEALELATLAADMLDRRHYVFAERGLRLEAALDEAPTRGDARLLTRGMGNLLDNALKYTPAGGVIRVETGLAGKTSYFRVQDDGPGIPAKDLSAIFEPFYRPDTSRSRETGGMGLGLAIVKTVAEAHGGSAHLTSEEGRGTLAEIRLPAESSAD